MPKASIIVPIYNVEKYLRKSIDYMINKTLEDIEIILVNDGSPDNSIDICKEYFKEDERIKVIDKPNGGVSSARNYGLEIAIGDYIGFSDPDDWIELDMYENMYKEIEITQSEICLCNYIIEKNRKVIPMTLDIKKDLLDKKDIKEDIIANMISAKDLNSNLESLMGNVWRLLIRRDFIDNHRFKFKQEVNLMEDLIFCIEIFLKSDKVCIVRGAYYHYVDNPNSAINTYREDMIDDQRKVFKHIENVIFKEGLYDELEEKINIRYVNIHTSSIANEVNKNNPKTRIEVINVIRNICSNYRLEKILINTNAKNYTYRKRIVLYALRKQHALFLYLYYNFLIKSVR